MILERFYIEGLAHASYLFGSDGEAAVVDPKRDVDDYIATAERLNLRIVAVLETHPHADFVSGHVELAQRTGGRIFISHQARTSYERVPVRDGDVIPVGSLKVVAMETPGHSPDSISYLVHENGIPEVLFSGDTLFAGDVGRPDLREADENPTVLAAALYESLFDKLLSLPEEVKVYPAHGAGSLCGRQISSAPFTTIGQERRSNWALQITDREEFVRRMTSKLPDRPAYFGQDVAVNLGGAKPLATLGPLRRLTGEELEAEVARGALVIDTRSAASFAEGHFPGSLNIGLGSPLFSTWAGFLVPFGRPIALVGGSFGSAEKARLELARIGYDGVTGYVQAGRLRQTEQMFQASACDLRDLNQAEKHLVLDVRTQFEWDANHIEGARHVPLPVLPKRLKELPRDRPIYVLCGSGYRSSIAASLLRANGFSAVRNIKGGMTAYLNTRCQAWQPADLVFLGEGI